MEKYVNMFIDLVNNKGFKYAVDYMGTYFFGLLDNVDYYSFIDYYYDDFIDFTNWLVNSTDPALFEQNYKDTVPLLYKLVDIIQETNEQPDSLQEALLKSFNAIRDDSKTPLYKIANSMLNHNKQIVITVDVFDENEQSLYSYGDKFTKVEQQNNPQMVAQNIVMALSLIIVYGGFVSITLREKGKEYIYGFEGYNGNSIRSLKEDEVADIFEDYDISKKSVDVEFCEHIMNTEQLN